MEKHSYQWIWKWHFIGGLLTLPIVILLTTTGIIYLFKDSYEKPIYQSLRTVSPSEGSLSYQEQWAIAKEQWNRSPSAMIIPPEESEATEFISGMFSHKSSLFVDPYSGKISGEVAINQTDMYQVRKLHGELLMGTYGTKIVELIASWMVVLLLTGVYIFWPRDRGWKGLFTIRTHLSRRILFRDLHGVTGFWFSAVLFLMLARGLPWTDVFGGGFKWVQDYTNTGYPATWSAHAHQSQMKGESVSLDLMVDKAKALKLEGVVNIQLPQGDKGVFSIGNETADLSSICILHFDQYSGELIKSHTWKDIGMLMKIRLWVMAFHQGEFGLWNWLVVLLTALALLTLSLSALFSYLLRKVKGKWGVPAVSKDFRPGWLLIIFIMIMGVFLPLFGLSLVFIFGVEMLKKKLFHQSNNV